jgi:hypothetical protein
LTYLLVALPMAWLAFAAIFGPKRAAPRMQQAATSR